MNIPLWNSAITNNSEARVARAPALHDGDGLYKWPFGDDAPAPPRARDRWLAASSLREASILLLLNDSKTTPFTFQLTVLPSRAPAPRNPRVWGESQKGCPCNERCSSPCQGAPSTARYHAAPAQHARGALPQSHPQHQTTGITASATTQYRET